MTILSAQNQRKETAAAYTTFGYWLPTQVCCKRLLFGCLFMQMMQKKKKEQAYAL
jgi:hypothetical protein